ncbi:tRNA:m4X modification enzyme TDEL_0E00570 [Torulaspora delbrueckii]|uniref:tRNA:m(4)X modification enzyme TRM13 n=1 Tax=Torulaspora delbrueckii TaxID=4950 RepID=G8ZUK6_TORDE|nr:hypothetical protein TDEL_0E00570 [Torulaspora delbrueckii]CCE92300.1 hypothetical protein TDEL_0E00570 [Torulaspora delbrueckii]
MMSKCGFYLEQKRRYCGMSAREGAGFCLEHSSDASDRVPCPLDRSHTVAKANLKRHVKKCNKLKQNHQNDQEEWYKPGLNSSSRTKVRETSLGDSLDECVAVVEKIYRAEFERLAPDQRENEFMERTRCQDVVSSKKHAIQQSSLIQHLQERGLLLDSSFVEFGCGRAELSRYINQTVADSKGDKPRYVLIDRASNRMKFDSKFRDDWTDLREDSGDHRFTKRCRVDIRDIWLDPLADSERQYVAVSKHLCGVATDLALRALENSAGMKLRGVCVAMCCRHVCDSSQYVNPEFVERLLRAYAPEEVSYEVFFQALRKMCSWATCGSRPEANEEEAVVKRREELGLMARRIVDEGRVRWVREKLGLKAELVKYVEKEISLENTALIASE